MRSSVLTAGTLTLNPNNGIVISDGDEVDLTAKEYKILKFLFREQKYCNLQNKTDRQALGL